MNSPPANSIERGGRRDPAGVPVRPGPTPAQERALRSHAGAARVASNWGLARVKAVMDQRAAEATYAITGDDLTPPLSWSLYSLRKDWNTAKNTVAPWWRECSKEAFSTGLDQLARALKNWGDSRTGKRKGKPAGFPRFKPKRKARLSRAASRRQGPDQRTRREPSNRWRRAAAALGQAHGRAADQRKDGLHKLTTRLAAECGTVVVEDLNVAGMMKNRWFASNKTCSGCGAVKAKLALSERTYRCDACGLVLDRDRPAATRDCEGERPCLLTRNG